MTVSLAFRWHPYRYFPYERRLARREVATLLGVEPSGEDGDSELHAEVESPPSKALLMQLTYFSEVRVEGRFTVRPTQALLEASASTTTSDLLKSVPVVKRQSTRYSAHGLHEYRGKFHPHIVRAVGNVLNIGRRARVLDPFCGSGTTLLEAAHAGWDAVGIDSNPLAVFISNTKLAALRVPADVLVRGTDAIVRVLASAARDLDFDQKFSKAAIRQLGSPTTTVTLPNAAYLQQWFTPSVLEQLAFVERVIADGGVAEVRDVARLVLSDCLRAVSLQEPADLRIRRRKEPKDNYPAIPLFMESLTARVAGIVRARAILGNPRGSQRAVLADSREGLPGDVRNGRRAFDCVITSPPYATALPYIDTQRLSLAFLGLAGAQRIRSLEAELIGAREITRKDRIAQEEGILAEHESKLPPSVVSLCSRALTLAASKNDGFRRKNMAALLARYFADMRAVFAAVLPVVDQEGLLAALVGPNRTTLGGTEVEIDTPRLLIDVAEHAGWKSHEAITLDAYQRFDMHRANSIRSEALIVLGRAKAERSVRSTMVAA